MSDRPRMDAARRQLAAFARPPAGHGQATVEIVGEINAAMVDRVDAALRNAPRATTVTLMIDTIGGDVSSAFRIYQAVRSHSAQTKRAIVRGKCHSAGVIIAMAADHRRACAGASILTHRTERRPPNDRRRWTAAQYAKAAAELKEIDNRVVDLIAERTGSNRAAIDAEDSTEKALPLAKALALGVIHQADGLPTRCRTDWPARAAKVSQIGVMIGLPRMFFSDAYMTACRAAPR